MTEGASCHSACLSLSEVIILGFFIRVKVLNKIFTFTYANNKKASNVLY